MDTTSNDHSSLEDHAKRGDHAFSGVFGWVFAGLVAILGLAVNGYRFGDSNHGITVPIVKQIMDRSLYPGDIVVETAASYPTLFYRALAAVVRHKDAIPATFFGLYVLSTAAIFAGAFRLGRWAGGPAAGILTVAACFPVRISLAGATLYRPLFSHSDVATALTVWALVWFLEGRRVLPLLTLSLGAYIHLLYSGYLLVPLGLIVLSEWKQVGARRTLLRLSAAVLPILPLAVWLLHKSVPMTHEWLELLRLRSAHHSFPSTFGAQLPEAAALLVLGAFGLTCLPAEKRRLAGLFFVGIAVQFVLGTALTEWHPLKAVLQYQPHRSWRYAMLLAQALVAADVIGQVRLLPDPKTWGRLVPVIPLVVPGCESLGLLAALCRAAFSSGAPQVAWPRGLAGLVLLAIGALGLPRPDLPSVSDVLLAWRSSLVPQAASLLILAALAGGLRRREGRMMLGAVALCAAFWVIPRSYDHFRPSWEAGPWRAAQDWVRLNTPKSAVILTPPMEGGFRVFSERTIVGEWKDGTQQYFDSDFAAQWIRRMRDSGGDEYAKSPDPQLLEVARLYGASYIVLPTRPRRDGLIRVYRNEEFAVYFVGHAPRTGEAAAPQGLVK